MPIKVFIDKAELRKLYLEERLCITQIAKRFNIAPCSIRARLREYGLALSSEEAKQIGYDHRRETASKPLTKGELEDLYVNKKMGRPAISKLTGISGDRLKWLFYIYDISCRSRAESNKLSWEAKRARGDILYKKNGRIESNGYVLIISKGHPRAYGKGGYVLEHILVWEETHQKPLPKGWHVHHINGIRADNRPENLLGLPSSRHSLVIPKLKERIRQLEIENRQLHRALEDGQMIFTIQEN